MEFSPNIDPPKLDLNPPYIVDMKRKLRQVQNDCNGSFSGNMDWRAKDSLKAYAQALEKQIGQEQKKIQQAYDEGLKAYNEQLRELQVAEEMAKNTTSIRDISLSSELISECNYDNENVNPIKDLDL